MSRLVCPVCSGALERVERTYRCENGHCYDIAKQNYVNLLMSNKSSGKRHGDDKLMVKARQDFLDKGYYLFLREEMCRLAAEHCGDRVQMLDAGCGEGWYTSAVKSALEDSGKKCSAVGVDISKTALMYAGKRDKSLTLAVASISSLPVAEQSCDLLLNVFAPDDGAEFRRVLRPGGLLMKVMPMERHLYGLKAAVYDRPYLNPPASYAPESFEPVCRSELRETVHLSCNEDIGNLFMMTPYYYKTGRDDQAKLAALSELDTEVEFAVVLLRRL